MKLFTSPSSRVLPSGYGDFTPQHVVGRLLALAIGLAGIVLTGLVAAVAVQALRAADGNLGNETEHHDPLVQGDSP